jgi:ParB family chromosome partitioning protein
VSPRQALGKGLAALIPERLERVAEREGAGSRPAIAIPEAAIPLALVDPNPHQPRATIRAAALQELAQSIRESGVVQPIVVRPHPETSGRYQIVAGERRYRAAQIAGLATVPAVVRRLSDEKSAEIALVENLQREDLTPIEEAVALRKLQEILGLTQEALAQRIGKDRATVANSLRLLRLPGEIKEAVGALRLSAGHARALLGLESAESQKEVAAQAVKLGLSVRQVEARVRALAHPAKGKPARRADANTKAAEERLRAKLGTRVEIHRRRRAGEIRVHFENEAELDRLFRWITRG